MPWYDFLNIGLLILIWAFILLRVNPIFLVRKYWLLFFAVYTITEFISIPISLKGENNLWLYNISKPIQFLLLIMYFKTVIQFKKTGSYIILLAAMVVCIVFLLSKKIDGYSSLEEVIYGAMITILCIRYYYSIIRTKDPINITLSEFWYCSSLFIYYGASLCINGSLDFMIKNNLPIAQKLFYGLVINSYIFYALTLYALFSNYKFNKSM